MVGRTDRIEQEYCPVFNKQVSIRISVLRLADGQKPLVVHNSYKCLDAAAVAECLCCKLINR